MPTSAAGRITVSAPSPASAIRDAIASSRADAVPRSSSSTTTDRDRRHAAPAETAPSRSRSTTTSGIRRGNARRSAGPTRRRRQGRVPRRRTARFPSRLAPPRSDSRPGAASRPRQARGGNARRRAAALRVFGGNGSSPAPSVTCRVNGNAARCSSSTSSTKTPCSFALGAGGEARRGLDRGAVSEAASSVTITRSIAALMRVRPAPCRRAPAPPPQRQRCRAARQCCG